LTKIKKNIVKSVLKGDGGNNKIKKSLGLIEKENLRNGGSQALLKMLMDDDKLPNKFIFTGKIIFITSSCNFL
jgi:hypothetical protein